jgi:hypothetical protein
MYSLGAAVLKNKVKQLVSKFRNRKTDDVPRSSRVMAAITSKEFV